VGEEGLDVAAMELADLEVAESRENVPLEPPL